MPFPKISHCLVCEMVRPEEGGKLTLLGFFGIPPDVQIQVPNLELPLSSLAFVFLGGSYQSHPADPPFQISLRIADSQGTVVVETPSAPLSIPPTGNKTTIAAAVSNVRFTAVGRHRVSLLVNGQSARDETFDLAIRPSAPQPEAT